jgi:hypothetical protein
MFVIEGFLGKVELISVNCKLLTFALCFELVPLFDRMEFLLSDPAVGSALESLHLFWRSFIHTTVDYCFIDNLLQKCDGIAAAILTQKKRCSQKQSEAEKT